MAYRRYGRKDKYINICTQIANKFKDYNEYLIFESMNWVYFFESGTFYLDYSTLTILNQAIVDTIKKSGGNNIERLILIVGTNDELDLTCSLE